MGFEFIHYMLEIGSLDDIIHQINEMCTIEYSVGFEKTDKFHKFSFTAADLVITTRSKQFDTMDYSLASMFEADASQEKKNNNLDSAKRLYSLSARHFEAVIRVAPLNEEAIFKETNSAVHSFESSKNFVQSIRKINRLIKYYRVISKKKGIKQHFENIVQER